MAETKIAPTLMFDATKEFRLLPNKLHTHGKYEVRSGDIIHLTVKQASAFKDKFEPVDPVAAFKIQNADIHQKFFALAESREAGTVAPAVAEPVKVPVAATA